MWREGIFTETIYLGLWIIPLGSSHNSLWHQSEADSSGRSTKNIPGDYGHHFLFLYTPDYHAQPDYDLHSPRFWLDPLVIFSPRLALRAGGRASLLAWLWEPVRWSLWKDSWAVIAFALFIPCSWLSHMGMEIPLALSFCGFYREGTQ